MPWILIGADQAMRHFEGAEKFLVCGHEGIKTRKVFFASGLRIDCATGARFEILENFWILEWKFQFVAIESLEDDDFVAVEAELFEAPGDVFGRFKKVGKKQNDTATMDESKSVLNELCKARAASGLQVFKLAQDKAELVGTLGRADKLWSR